MFVAFEAEEHKPIIINDRGINYPDYSGIELAEEEYGEDGDYYYDGDLQGIPFGFVTI